MSIAIATSVASTALSQIEKFKGNIPPASTFLQNAVAMLFSPSGATSLTAFGKIGRISSRVYIDSSVASDPVMTDILKTVHTQYCGFILTAMQMNQFVSQGVTVQDLLHVVATEDHKPHIDVAASFGVDSDRVYADNKKGMMEDYDRNPDGTQKNNKNEKDKKPNPKTESIAGEVVSFAGDNHIPAGKILEVTLTNPANPDHKITVNLLVQLAPYLVPEALAVQFIVKDAVPSFYQRWIQWRTGEISFWKDFVLGNDIFHNRQKMIKLDPTGVFADMVENQQKQRGKTFLNLAAKNDSARARNIANSVLIFNQDTVTRAKAESAINLNDYDSRQKYFAMTFAMIIVVVDVLYNQVTFYYNGISDVGTFSFDQMKIASKGSSMDLVSVMNALNQGKSPKF